MNDTEGIAAIYAGLAAEKGMNGKAIYVEGNRGWEYDENIRRLEPQWLGEANSKELNRGNALMGLVSHSRDIDAVNQELIN